jgi:hypothetical protein
MEGKRRKKRKKAKQYHQDEKCNEGEGLDNVTVKCTVP